MLTTTSFTRPWSKPANTYTDLGLAFSVRPAASGCGPYASSSHSVRNGRLKKDGLARYGAYGVNAGGPKPPVWVMTGETVGNAPVKVFLHVEALDTIDASVLPTDGTSPGTYAVFVGTPTCGASGMYDCSEVAQCTRVCSAVPTSSTCSAVPTADTRLTCTGGVTYATPCDWMGVKLVRLDPTLLTAVTQQVLALIAGTDLGWRTALADPAVNDASSVDYNPGNLLGMLQWNSDASGDRVAATISTTACRVAPAALGAVQKAAVALKGTVALAPEYSVATQFVTLNLPVVLDVPITGSAPGSATKLLAHVAVIVPKASTTSGLRFLSSPDAGAALCCRFADASSLECLAVATPSALAPLNFADAAANTAQGVSLDVVSYSVADSVQLNLAVSPMPTGTAVATSQVVPAYLGSDEFTITPFALAGSPGVIIANTATGESVVAALGVDAPLPLTAAQVGANGVLVARVGVHDPADFSGFVITLFRREGVAAWPFLTTPLLPGSPLFTSTFVDNQSVVTTTATTGLLAARPSTTTGLAVNPQAFGVAQYVVTSAVLLADSTTTSVFFDLTFSDAAPAGMRFGLSLSTSYARSPFVYTVISGATTLTAVDRQVVPITVAGLNFTVTQTVRDSAWVVQVVPV